MYTTREISLDAMQKPAGNKGRHTEGQHTETSGSARERDWVVGLQILAERQLAEWIVSIHDTAFAWSDEERGAFDPKYFVPIEIPHIEHVPWVLQQGLIPRGILNEVIKIIEDKWRSRVYDTGGRGGVTQGVN